MQKTFKDYRATISISQMAELLGYKKDPGSGIKYDCYYLGEKNTPVDEIVIYNPGTPAKSTYFSRKGSTEDKGSLINFILNRLEFFPYCTKSGFAGVNEVLERYSGQASEIIPSQKYSKGSSISHDFHPEYWNPRPLDSNNEYLLNRRKISSSTIDDFRRKLHIYVVGKNNHIGFPFRRPGRIEITNFEMRNFFPDNNQNYKGFCSGGDKANSVWLAHFVPLDKITDVCLFESAIDAMSFYELRNYDIHTTTAFVSTGGSVTQNQIASLTEVFSPKVNWHCCYDNDASGKAFDVSTIKYIKGEDCKAFKRTVDGVEEIHIHLENHSYVFPADSFSSSDFFKYDVQHIGKGKIDIIKPDTGKDWNENLCHIKDRENSKRFFTAPTPMKELNKLLSNLDEKGFTAAVNHLLTHRQEMVMSLSTNNTYDISLPIIDLPAYSLSAHCSFTPQNGEISLEVNNISIVDKMTGKDISGDEIINFLKKENIHPLTDLNLKSYTNLLSKGSFVFVEKKKQRIRSFERSVFSSGWGIKEQFLHQKNASDCAL